MPLVDVSATATTPGEQATATIARRDQVRISLYPGYFQRASAEQLAGHLRDLMPRLIEARRVAVYRQRSIDFGVETGGESPAISRDDRAYVDARSRLVVTGGDPASVLIEAVGLEHWSVEVDAAWRDAVDEEEFCRAASEAASELIRHQYDAARALKVEVYRT